MNYDGLEDCIIYNVGGRERRFWLFLIGSFDIVCFLFHVASVKAQIFVFRRIMQCLKYRYGRDSVEPAVKPGETALVCTYYIVFLFTNEAHKEATIFL